MASSSRRSLQAWREEKQLTPEELEQAGAGISADLIRQWEAEGEPPAAALPHLISVARALEAPLEEFDLGPTRRGWSEAGYSFVIFARGQDDRRWRARVGSWGWPAGATPDEVIAERVTSGTRAVRPTSDAALGALETELRALVRHQVAGEEAPQKLETAGEVEGTASPLPPVSAP
jgi:hypothetical protein